MTTPVTAVRSGTAGIVPGTTDVSLKVRGFPGPLLELRSWFRLDADCVDYVGWLRWPDRFVRPWSTGVGDLAAAASSDCGHRISVTSQTRVQRTRNPLTVWFETLWLIRVLKQGVTVHNLQRVTVLGSDQAEWTMTHTLRTVMSRSGRNQLTDRIEVDETYVGGMGKTGQTGRGAANQTFVADSVERRGRGFELVRPQAIPDASTMTLAIGSKGVNQ